MVSWNLRSPSLLIGHLAEKHAFSSPNSPQPTSLITSSPHPIHINTTTMNSLFDAVRATKDTPGSFSRLSSKPECRIVTPKLSFSCGTNLSLADSIGNLAVPRRCESQLTYSKARLDKLKRLHGYYVDSGSQTDRSEEIAQLDELIVDCIQVKAAEGRYNPIEDEWI